MLFHNYDIMSYVVFLLRFAPQPPSGNTSLPDVDSPRFAENTSGTRNGSLEGSQRGSEGFPSEVGSESSLRAPLGTVLSPLTILRGPS